MKRETTRSKPARSAQDDSAQTSVGAPAEPGAAVQFVAERAHGIADALYEFAKDRIDQAQRSAGPFHLETVWQRAQPLLVRTAEFVRAYPLRSGLILALLAGAALLTRTAPAPRS